MSASTQIRQYVPLLVMQIGSSSNNLHMLQLTDTHQNILPTAFQPLSILEPDIEQRPNSLHILCLHLSPVVQEGKLSERGDKRVAFELEVKDRGNSYGIAETIHAQLYDFDIVRLLHWAGYTSEKGHPGYFEYGTDVDEVRSDEKLVTCFAFALSPHHRLE